MLGVVIRYVCALLPSVFVGDGWMLLRDSAAMVMLLAVGDISGRVTLSIGFLLRLGSFAG